MSWMSASALAEIHNDMTDQYERIDHDSLSEETIMYVENAKNNGFQPEQVLLHMIQVLITDAHGTGVLDIPPPVLSRVYQTLSRGLVNWINAKKITTCLYPFP